MRSRQRALGLLAALLSAAIGVACNRGPAASQGCSVDDDCHALICPAGQLPACLAAACACQPDVPLGEVGRFSSLQVSGSTALVCAYNSRYGDLMLGRRSGPGVVQSWEFVDGVPDVAPSHPASSVRGGITDPGDDVGRYCSLQLTAAGDPVMAYYDVTHQSLRFAAFGAVRWHHHLVDAASGTGRSGDDLGRYAALTLDRQGQPGIAYHAEAARGASGQRESQLRFAQAHRPDPQTAADWTVTVVQAQPLPAVDPKADPATPVGIALFIAAARKPDGGPALAYYDQLHGNLVYVDADASASRWSAPRILDGVDGQGSKTADVGQYPSLVVDSDGTAHLSYLDSSHGRLLYTRTGGKAMGAPATVEVIDSGYRDHDEQTQDGLPAPVYHLVGASSSLQLAGSAVVVAYQDATALQLRLAQRDGQQAPEQRWTSAVVAGHGTPFGGSYGFYAQNRVAGAQAILSSYAVNQQLDDPAYYVEIFALPLRNIIQ